MSQATSRDPFQQIKMCRNPQGSMYILFFFFFPFSDADYICVELNMTQLDTVTRMTCVLKAIFLLDNQKVVQTILKWIVLL